MSTLPEWMSRSELLLGEEAITRLMSSHVIIAGLGGVGGIAAEMLARSGVGELTLIDADVVEPSNRNRQAAALISTNNKLKTEIIAERILDINKDAKINIKTVFLQNGITEPLLDEAKYDYAVDCIDTLSPKVFYLRACLERGIPVVSSMGAGGKLDPTQIKISDISESYGCKLAKYVRKRLKSLGIRKGIKVVYSPEDIDPSRVVIAPEDNPKKSIIGTVSYMPSVIGCAVASVVIRDLGELRSYEPGAPKRH